jgi:hypothetical protein
MVAYELYQLCQNQLIVSGFGDVIALNYSAVISVLNLYEVDDRPLVFEKIIYISRFDIEKLNKKHKKK